MQILPAEPDDFDSIIDLLSHYNLITQDVDLKKQKFVKLTKTNNLFGIGAIELYQPYGLIRSLAVSPDEIKQGFATRIIKNLEQIAKAEEVEELYLLTETAEMYFAKLGYKTIDRETTPETIKQTNQFSALCPASAVVMVKSIIPLV